MVLTAFSLFINFTSYISCMGRFNCIPLFTGTLDEFCFYQRGGRYYFRSRSSLTAERVKKDPAFAKTRHFAALLAQASRIGSAVYATLLVNERKHRMYRQFTGEAMTWLKIGWTPENVLAFLLKRYDKRGLMNLFKLPEKPLTGKEEGARQIARMNRRLLRAIRATKDDEELDELMESVPRGWQADVMDWYSDE